MGPGAKSTRGWDAERGVSMLQREKEDAHDYRYFPDPDLPPVHTDEACLGAARAAVGEPVLARMDRYAREAGVSGAEAAALAEERETALLYDRIVDGLASEGDDRAQSARLAANLLLQGGLRLANERAVPLHALGFTQAQAMAIVRLRLAGDISANSMDELLGMCCEEPGADARGLAEARGMLLVRDAGQLETWCDEVIAEQSAVAQQVREGKVQAVGRLIGAVMARSGGAADAKAVREKLLHRLGQSSP